MPRFLYLVHGCNLNLPCELVIPSRFDQIDFDGIANVGGNRLQHQQRQAN